MKTSVRKTIFSIEEDEHWNGQKMVKRYGPRQVGIRVKADSEKLDAVENLFCQRPHG